MGDVSTWKALPTVWSPSALVPLSSSSLPFLLPLMHWTTWQMGNC